MENDTTSRELAAQFIKAFDYRRAADEDWDAAYAETKRLADLLECDIASLAYIIDAVRGADLMTSAPPAYDMLLSTTDSWNNTPTAVIRQLEALSEVERSGGRDHFTMALRDVLYSRLHMATAVYYR